MKLYISFETIYWTKNWHRRTTENRSVVGLLTLALRRYTAECRIRSKDLKANMCTSPLDCVKTASNQWPVGSDRLSRFVYDPVWIGVLYWLFCLFIPVLTCVNYTHLSTPPPPRFRQNPLSLSTRTANSRVRLPLNGSEGSLRKTTTPLICILLGDSTLQMCLYLFVHVCKVAR